MIMSDGTRHQNMQAENNWKACIDFANGEMSLEVPENFTISKTNLMPSSKSHYWRILLKVLQNFAIS